MLGSVDFSNFRCVPQNDGWFRGGWYVYRVFQLCSTFSCMYVCLCICIRPKMQPTTNEFRNLLCFSIKISNIRECHMDKIHHSWFFLLLLTHCFFFGVWFLLRWCVFLTDTKSDFTYRSLCSYDDSFTFWIRWGVQSLPFSLRFCYLTFFYLTALDLFYDNSCRTYVLNCHKVCTFNFNVGWAY